MDVSIVIFCNFAASLKGTEWILQAAFVRDG